MLKPVVTTFFAGLLMATVAAPSPAHAQRGAKVREVKKDTREIRDDRGDARQFARLAEEVLTYQGKPKLMAAFDTRALAAFGAEVRESKREVRQDTREIRRDRGKVAAAKGPVRKLDAALDKADDKMDRRAEKVELAGTAALRAQYAALQGDASPAATQRKASILRSAATQEVGEVVKTKGERREDVRDVKQNVRRKGLRR